MVGRELGHVAAGHTRLTSLLSVNGRENAIISLIFGAWLRRTEHTADRLGLLCCASLEAAKRSITIATLHEFGRHVDIEAFASQNRELSSDSVLRMGQWLSAQRYATQRMARLAESESSPSYLYWMERVARQPAQGACGIAVARSGRVERQDCAGFGRRLGAVLIDCIVVAAIFGLTTPHVESTSKHTAVYTGVSNTVSRADVAKLSHDPTVLGLLQRFLGVISADGEYFIVTLFGYPQDFHRQRAACRHRGADAGYDDRSSRSHDPARFGGRPSGVFVCVTYSPLAFVSWFFGPFTRIQCTIAYPARESCDSNGPSSSSRAPQPSPQIDPSSRRTAGFRIFRRSSSA